MKVSHIQIENYPTLSRLSSVLDLLSLVVLGLSIAGSMILFSGPKLLPFALVIIILGIVSFVLLKLIAGLVSLFVDIVRYLEEISYSLRMVIPQNDNSINSKPRGKIIKIKESRE